MNRTVSVDCDDDRQLILLQILERQRVRGNRDGVLDPCYDRRDSLEDTLVREAGAEGSLEVVLADVKSVHGVLELLAGDAGPEPSRAEVLSACLEVPELPHLRRQLERTRGAGDHCTGDGEVSAVPEVDPRRLHVRAQVIQPQPLTCGIEANDSSRYTAARHATCVSKS